MSELSPRLARALLGAGALLLVALLVAGAVYDCGLKGEALATTPVADDPNEIIVEVPEGRTKLVPWSDYEIEGPTALFNTNRMRYGLPRVLDYVVRVEQEGEPIAERRCEVFGFTASSDGSIRRGLTTITIQSRDRLLDCAIVARPGTATVRVQRAWVAQVEGLSFRRTAVELRAVEP